MNTTKIPFSITVVSQIKDAGPFVGVLERYGKEIGRTYAEHETMAGALFAGWELKLQYDQMNEEQDDPRDYEPDTRKEIDDDREDSGKAELARVFLGGGE